jgi:hypothetical protein
VPVLALGLGDLLLDAVGEELFYSRELSWVPLLRHLTAAQVRPWGNVA